MKRGFELETPGLRLVAVICAGLTTFGGPAFALTLNNPYEPIVGRNVFALRPPTPVTNALTTPVVSPAGIELQGLTTILGRPQVLLKIKLPAKAPEPAKDQSVVLDVGQREGEVEVLAIDMAAGKVQLRNQGKDLALDMKDAAKPSAGPALAIPAPAGRPNLPGIPPPQVGVAPAAARPVPGVSTFGGASGATPAASARPSLPSRNLRASTTGGGLSPQTATRDDRSLPLEAQMALIEIERERTKAAVEAGKMPPLPPMSFPDK